MSTPEPAKNQQVLPYYGVTLASVGPKNKVSQNKPAKPASNQVLSNYGVAVAPLEQKNKRPEQKSQGPPKPVIKQVFKVSQNIASGPAKNRALSLYGVALAPLKQTTSSRYYPPTKPAKKHEHYKEHHGPHPKWKDVQLKNVNPIRYSKRGCCGEKRKGEKDSMYRLQEIKLPQWITFLARVSLVWEFILYVLTVITFALVTYAAFFAFFEEKIWNTVFVTDVIFSIDIILRLTVEIWRYRNQVVVVVFTVPYSMLQFTLDVITIVPFHQIYLWTVGGHLLSNLSKIDYWRFNRFIRLYRSYIFFQTLQNERRANEKIMFLIRFTNYYIGFIHLTSCLLMYLVGVEPLDFLLNRNRELLEKTWMRVVSSKKLGYPTEYGLQLYILATNLATATVTTVGYGDLSATNEVEMVWCIFFMLFGAIFLNGYFTSQLTTFELELDGARFDLYFRVNEIMKYLTGVGTLPLFNAKVEEYYKYLWSYREGVYEVQFMRHLPLAFHEDLLFDICQEMFDKSFLFNGVDEALLRAVSKIVNVALYNPEMILCRKGGYANKLYYILQGECRVMSKYCSGKAAAVLRAGSIIGEANLFFSYPYTATIETRTCCQFIILEKEELIRAMDDFRDQLWILRTKSQEKILKVYQMHNIYGVEPVCWIAAKTDLENPSEPKASTIRRTMRWGSGINREVIEDVIDDTKDCVIFDTPCFQIEIVKNHLTPFITSLVPEIMDTEVGWVKYWNTFVMVVALFTAFIGPYCVAFGQNSEFEKNICDTVNVVNYGLAFCYVADILVEIIAAAPVYGFYYKFWDGLQVKKYDPMFYFDIMAAIPLGFFTKTQQDLRNVIDNVFKSLKLWKVIRYLHFLDNRYPLSLFWFRLAQTILVLIYGIHFIACISYWLACSENGDTGIKDDDRDTICAGSSWLGSYQQQWKANSPEQTVPRWMLIDTLKDEAAYLYSFYYSSATLTSAGFGDFSPQRGDEMMWAIGFQLFGFYLIGYYTSTLTSALSCVVRPRLAFQQKLISIQHFMAENHLKEALRNRIVEYFNLQNQLRGGVPLAKGICHMMYDTPEYLRDDVLYLEVVELLEGIPVFSKMESDVIIKMSSSMKRFLIPPNTTFLHKGEIRRVMYLIKHGSIGIYGDYSEQPVNILEASSHFGIRDLLFGEPCHFTIKSLSHVYMYSIKYHQVQDAMAEDEEFWGFVNHEKAKLQTTIDEMISIYSQLAGPGEGSIDIFKKIPSWVEIPTKPKKEEIEKPGYEEDWETYEKRVINEEYDELFEGVKFGKLLKMFLMRRSVHPVGFFASVWNCVLSVGAFLTIIFMCIETFQTFRKPGFRCCQWALDIIALTDIYVKMHWGYFNTRGHGNSMLITHPLKTSLNYILHGTFVLDVIGCTPLEMIFPLLGWTDWFGYGEAATWYTKLRWTRILQIKRLTMIFEIAHSVFNHRNTVLLMLYVVTTLFLCTLLGSISLYTACPWKASFWQKGDENRLPLCLVNVDDSEPPYWATVKSSILYWLIQGNPDIMANPVDRWILSIYYVSQVVLVIGFGDLTTLRTPDLLMLVFMQVFGFIFMRCVIADVTAAEVDSDEIRSTYIEQMQTLDLVMRRERVPHRLMHTVMEHLKYTWKRSKGLQPRDLFADLHPALESDLFREIVGKELSKVPLFLGFPQNILKTISGFLKKLYFLKGERIMRCGNLEYEMCIIIRGKVYICDMHLNYICTLSTGDCFGETSMFKGKRRYYNAVAITNVEVYYFTANNFELVLERYPTIKIVLEKKLGEGDSDYFEQGLTNKLETISTLNPKQQQEYINAFAYHTKIIKSTLSLREDLGENVTHQSMSWLSPKRWVGYGNLNDDLPFLYFAKGRYRGRGDTFAILIHPKCMFMQIFTVIISWLSYATPAIATYETCFIGAGQQVDVVSEYIVRVSRYIEFLFLFNLFLRFIVAYEQSEGVFCKTYRGIIIRYVTSPSRFFVDAVGTLPFIIDECTTEKLQETSFKYVYLLKIIRLVRYYKHQLGKKYDLSISTFRYKITISVTSFCLMAHMLACVFYYISSCIPKIETTADLCPSNGKYTWTIAFKESFGFLNDKKDFIEWKWWIRSLYWVVTTVSTTGFGDVLPYTVKEMAVATICIFCGAFILSIILSDFTTGMASLTKAHREYMYQVQLLVKHLRNIGLSKTRQNQVMMHFLMMWSRCRGTSYSKAATILPICLQIETCNALFGRCLSTVPYFRGHDQDSFIRQLSVRVSHSIFIPGVCIVKEGDQGSSMYIVYKGLISATKLPQPEMNLPAMDTSKTSIRSNTVVEDEKKESEEPQFVSVYNVGDVFGRFPALFREEVYKKSYRAETRVEVLEVRQKDIEHLAKLFPYFRRNMTYLIASRYSRDGSGQNIFSEMKSKRENLFDLTEDLKAAQAHPTKKPKKSKETGDYENQDGGMNLDSFELRGSVGGSTDSELSQKITLNPAKRQKKDKHKKAQHHPAGGQQKRASADNKPKRLSAENKPKRPSADDKPKRVSAENKAKRPSEDDKPKRLSADTKPKRLSADERNVDTGHKNNRPSLEHDKRNSHDKRHPRKSADSDKDHEHHQDGKVKKQDPGTKRYSGNEDNNETDIDFIELDNERIELKRTANV